MGTYTDFFLNVKLAANMPAEMVQTLTWMACRDMDAEEWIDRAESIGALHAHPLFETPRWLFLLQGGGPGMEHFEQRKSSFTQQADGYELIVQSCLNVPYDEIRLFCDWLGSFALGMPGTQVGATVCFEDDTVGSIVLDRGTLAWITREIGRNESNHSIIEQVTRLFGHENSERAGNALASDKP